MCAKSIKNKGRKTQKYSGTLISFAVHSLNTCVGIAGIVLGLVCNGLVCSIISVK